VIQTVDEQLIDSLQVAQWPLFALSIIFLFVFVSMYICTRLFQKDADLWLQKYVYNFVAVRFAYDSQYIIAPSCSVAPCKLCAALSLIFGILTKLVPSAALIYGPFDTFNSSLVWTYLIYLLAYYLMQAHGYGIVRFSSIISSHLLDRTVTEVF
jgi:hypothetical protein